MTGLMDDVLPDEVANYPDRLWRGVLRRLIARRLTLGLTQLEVSQQLGVNDQLVGKWEANMKRPNAYNLVAWVEFLGGEMTFQWRAPEWQGRDIQSSKLARSTFVRPA